MATVDMVWAALESQINTAMAGTNPLLSNAAVSPTPLVLIDWPPEKSLDAVKVGVPQGLPTLISIFDRGVEKNITQSPPIMNALPATYGTTGAALVSDSLYLAPGDSIHITGSGVPLVNDAFCLTLMNGSQDPNQIFANYTTPNGTTSLATALAGFVTQINLLTDIVASVSGDVVTVTNNTQAPFDVRTEVANVGGYTVEGFRWLRNIQVTIWSRTPADRSTYGNILEQLFTQLEINYGFLTTDNSACRLEYIDDLIHKDLQLVDIYRRDFLLTIDYPVLYKVPAWTIQTIPQTFASPIPD